MKWTKLGKVFDPTEHELPNRCDYYAQSPQALVLDDRVRVYFSTRPKVGDDGKYLSHVAYVDMSKDLGEILEVPTREVISLGKLGCYDEHGIFPLNVLKQGNRVLGYVSGWNRRVSVVVDTGIGLATSEDEGRTFTRIGDGPVVCCSPREPFLVGDPFVQVFEGRFYMWYIFGTIWERPDEGSQPDRTYKIGYAVSDDGVSWQKPEEGRTIIPDKLGEKESQALPTVACFGGRYHMFFCYRQSFDFRANKDRGYRIGYAYSEDLKNWVRDDDLGGISGTEGAWDSDMQCYPHIYQCDGQWYLLYNGNEFGRYGFGAAVLDLE